MPGRPGEYEASGPSGWYPSDDDFREKAFQLFRRSDLSGAYNPYGNERLIEAGRMNAANISGNLQRQMQIASSMSGLDPAQQASYRLQGMLGAQGQQAQLSNEALMDAYRRAADMSQQFAGGTFGLGRQIPQPPEKQSGFSIGPFSATW
jgi:hypothetical protein